MCDDVFTEDDALSPEKRQISLGRIYEEWKRVRGELDPGWTPADTPRRTLRGPMRRSERLEQEGRMRSVQRDLG